MIDPKRLEELIWQARARVTWGEHPEAISKWLTSEGVEQQRIDEILGATLKERDVEVRKLGVTETVIGLAITGAVGGVLLIWIESGTVRSRGFALLLVAGAYGLFRLIRGLLWLMQGKHVSGSVGDLGNDGL